MECAYTQADLRRDQKMLAAYARRFPPNLRQEAIDAGVEGMAEIAPEHNGLRYVVGKRRMIDFVRGVIGREGQRNAAQLEAVKCAHLTNDLAFRPTHADPPKQTNPIKPPLPISKRQWQVCAGTVRGLSIDEIALEMRVSRKTVDVHKAILYRRLGVHSLWGLIDRLSGGVVAQLALEGIEKLRKEQSA